MYKINDNCSIGLSIEKDGRPNLTISTFGQPPIHLYIETFNKIVQYLKNDEKFKKELEELIK